MDLLESHLSASRTMDRSSSRLRNEPAMRSAPSHDHKFSATASPDFSAKPITLPSQSVPFLTLIAAQERRVLELKEDLSKAEEELKELKRQWAAHESNQNTVSENGRQKDGQSPTSAAGLPRPAQRRLQRSSEAGTARSGQRIFSSSKHARALSLLSGREPPGRPALPALEKAIVAEQERGASSHDRSRANSDSPRNVQRSSDHDDYIQSGKQLVGDFRSGFWTFLEDLRQVTVGEEVLNSTENIGKSRESTFEESKSRVTRDHNKQKENSTHSILDGKQKGDQQLVGDRRDKVTRQLDDQNTSPEELSDCNEDWSSWESNGDQAMSEKTVSSPIERTASLFSEISTPRTSISSTGPTPRPQRLSMPIFAKEDLRWPSISSLSPVKLTQTASKLMLDWEENFRSGTRLSSPVQDAFPQKESKAD